MNANTVLMCKGVRPPSGSSSCVYTSQFAPKGSGGNLVTECENKARSGTKVALAALGCVTKVVEARRVPPAIDESVQGTISMHRWWWEGQQN